MLADWLECRLDELLESSFVELPLPAPGSLENCLEAYGSAACKKSKCPTMPMRRGESVDYDVSCNQIATKLHDKSMASLRGYNLRTVPGSISKGLLDSVPLGELELSFESKSSAKSSS